MKNQRKSPKAVRLLLIRHGQSEANLARHVVGQSGTNLTDHGRKQVQELSQALKKKALPVSKILCSDTIRTKQTANLLFPGVPYRVEPNFNEIDAGSVTSWSRERFDRLFPDFFRNFSPKKKFPGGESHQEMHSRIVKATKSLLQETKASASTVAVVCHAGTISSILHHVFKIPLKHYSCFETANASLTVLIFTDQVDTPKLLAFNAVASSIKHIRLEL